MEPWIGEEEKHAIKGYLDSGGWLTDRVARNWQERVCICLRVRG